MKRWSIINHVEQMLLGVVEEAVDEDDAIEVWLNEAGYDSIEHAAHENFCHESDIVAEPR